MKKDWKARAERSERDPIRKHTLTLDRINSISITQTTKPLHMIVLEKSSKGYEIVRRKPIRKDNT